MKHKFCQKTTTIVLLCGFFSFFSCKANADYNPSIAKKLEYATHLKKSMYDVVDKKKLTDQEKLESIIHFLMDEIDVEFFAKGALGRNFNKLDKELQAKYINTYRDFLEKSLKINAKEAFLIPSKDVKLLKKIQDLGSDSNVLFRITPENEEPYDLVIRIGVPTNCTSLKIRDISVETISIIESHMVLFTTEIENNGINSIFAFMKNLYSK